MMTVMIPLHKMMATIFLLVAVLISTPYASAQTCAVDNAIDQKIKTSVASQVSAALGKCQMICTNVVERGRLASCPAGFKVTACSCGMACGSWDIRGDAVCHCQCAVMDWASARCCKMAFS